MNIKSKGTILLLVVALMATACASPARLYKQGKYYPATLAAIKKLRSKPDDVETQQILKQSYNSAVENSLRTINSLQHNPDPVKYYNIVVQYQNLCDMASKIYSTPAAYNIIPNPTDYSEELAAARTAGAEEYYSRAMDLMESNRVEDALLAHNYLKNANNFIAGYKDVHIRIAEAREKSILKVLVKRPIVPQAYSLEVDFFYEDLTMELNRLSSKAVDFFLPNYPRDLYIHHSITLDFTSFNMAEPRERRRVERCTKDSVLTGYTNVRGNRYPVYGTVKATYIEYTMEVAATGTLSIRITDNTTNRTVYQDKVASTHVWETKWATYQGDERALSPRQKAMCRQRREAIPQPQYFFYEVSKPMYHRAVQSISHFYRGY